MLSLSTCFLFKCSEWIPAFFNLYDKSRPENQTKRSEIDSFRIFLKVLVYVFVRKESISGDPQKHFGNSRRFGPLLVSATLVPAPERLRRARRPLAALPLHCVRNRVQPVRKFQSIVIPPAQCQAMADTDSQRWLVRPRPESGLG
jgi:hypothetical protein